jgi:hypothetical protein
MVVNSRFVFQTQRVLPTMTLISVAVLGNRVTVSGPDMDSLTFTIPEDVPALRRSCRCVVIPQLQIRPGFQLVKYFL